MSDYDDYFYGTEDNGDQPDENYDIEDVLFGSQGYDEYAQGLMMEAVSAGEDSAAWRDLGDYLWDEYGIDLEAEWDWVDFREWYDAS